MRSAVVRHAPAGTMTLSPPKWRRASRVLAAVVEPENAEGENAVDDGRGLGCADADDGIGRGSFEQTAADICGTEAVLEIHGGAQAVDFGADEVRA